MPRNEESTYSLHRDRGTPDFQPPSAAQSIEDGIRLSTVSTRRLATIGTFDPITI